MPLWQRGLAWLSRTRVPQGGRKSTGSSVFASSSTSRKGSHGGGVPYVSWSTSLPSSSSSVLQVGTFPQFLDHLNQQFCV